MTESRVTVNDLARACAYSADAAVWEQFVRLCAPLASLVAMRVCRQWTNHSSPVCVDDIVQEIFLKLCEQERRILRKFEARGEDSFMGLLRVASTSVANDYFRRMYSVKRGGQVVTTSLTEDASSTTQYGVQKTVEMQQEVLFAQLDQKLRAAPDFIGDRDRTIFWLYYRQGFTAEEIAGLPQAGLTSKGVESALRRVVTWLRGEIESRNTKEAELSGA